VNITITLDPTTGAVSISGPLENTIICLGLLEMAKSNVIEYARKAAEGKKILNPATGGLA
jgi:hypothetical protein